MKLEDTYIKTYQSLVSFCSMQYPFNEKTFLQASLMTYGWMPTTFKIKGDINKSILAVNRLIEKEEPDPDLMAVAQKTINNSIVGLSKLLHFAKPAVFPIWDSRIASIQFDIKHQYAYNKPQPYKMYFELIHNAIASSDIVTEIRNYAKERIPYQVTDVRAVEFYIFSGNRIMIL